MPFPQGVEEARYHVNEAMKSEKGDQNIGEELDSMLEKDVLDCQEYEEVPHPYFVYLDPDEEETDENVNMIKKTAKIY